MKRLVVDAGPLLHLQEAAGLHLLPFIGRVLICPAVLAEVRLHSPAFGPGSLPSWLEPIAPSAVANRQVLSWQQAGLLHQGEAEALAVALEGSCDWFLTDDAAARLVAESQGIETHGSLGVVLWAAAKNLIGKPEAEEILTGLEHSSLWLSPAVRSRARKALDAIFPGE
jgi:predicted nucleic acid-binding protein